MTLTNRELFYRDPTDAKIPNDGVAQVGRPASEKQWDVLRWELQSFVCDGEYARGLDRILGSFLTNLGQAQQPAVWISGFYGSGKSHLARVLEALWRDVPLPDGATARALTTLPDEVRDQLTELTAAGKREGGLWSAAGTLGSGKSDAVRLAFLSVLFDGAGLPQEYPLARFVMWANKNNYLDSVSAALVTAGKALDKEIHDLYVSPVIAKALLEADPTLGTTIQDVRALLKAQFPPTTKDITDDEMFDTMDDVIRLQSTTRGKLPLALVVLDEMQQYIGDDSDKALAVQNVVEGCSARFQSQILLVATGQSALTATPTLQKLTDRFAVQVALSDRDVETVVRSVVLRKRPEHIEELQATLDNASGEIDRHLGGTQLAPRGADKPDLVPDYPLLPTRRRFWELALRSIDRAGKAGVLRTQLKIIHEAARHVADEPAGHVVGGDFIYGQQAPGMLQSGVLLKELDELVRGLRTQGPDGELKSRICALIFLISQLPSSTLSGETGLRATAPFLADLLVEDLKLDGAPLRKRVPEALEALATAGRLMRIDDEFRLQTEEGAEWDLAYRGAVAAIRDDPTRMTQIRNERLLEAVDNALSGLQLAQGASSEIRRIAQHWGQDEPTISGAVVPVWIRDEWSVAESVVRRAAAEAGDESPLVFVLLPKRDADHVKDASASYLAAEETLRRPTPQTDEGKAAFRSMRTRLEGDSEDLSKLFREVVASARVFQGGGGEVTATDFRDAIATVGRRSLVRLFPRFTVADNPNWGKVVTRARDGAPDALDAVGHHGDAASHPVAKEILATVAVSGTKGSDLLRAFGEPPYGWPKDAINGALYALLAAGNLRASQDGGPLGGPKELLQTQVGKATFYKEDEPPTVEQRMQVRGLLGDAGIAYEAGREGPKIPALLQHLKDLSYVAGGPPPLPDVPDSSHIDELLAFGGNGQFRAVADDHSRLGGDLQRWRSSGDERRKREALWSQAERLLTHAHDLPVADSVAPALTAIQDGRLLLAEPDPLAPILSELMGALREELEGLEAQLSSAQRTALEDLEAWDQWSLVDADTRSGILLEAGLDPVERLNVPSEALLLAELDARPLPMWRDRIALVPTRRDLARRRAAQLLEPESVTVSLPRATLKSATDLEAYVEELRARVKPYLDDSTTVIL